MDHSFVRRIFSILDIFSASKPEIGVREAARLIDLSPSTCGRLFSILRDEGVLKQDPFSKQYRLSGRVLHWANSYRSGSPLNDLALPYMRTLFEQTDETVSLYRLEADHRICIHQLESGRSVRIVESVGQAFELYIGSGGRAILAYLPEDRAESILRSVEGRTGVSVDRERLRRQLQSVRDHGYAVSHGESTADASGVAIPVFGDNGEPIGSISVSGPTSRFENAARLNEIVKALEKVRRDLSPCSGQPVLRMIHSGKGEIQNDA